MLFSVCMALLFFTTRRFVLSLVLLLVLMFGSVLFGIVIAWLAEERAGLYDARAFHDVKPMQY